MTSTLTAPAEFTEVTSAYAGPVPVCYAWGEALLIEDEVTWVNWTHVNAQGEHMGSFAHVCDVVEPITPDNPFVFVTLEELKHLQERFAWVEDEKGDAPHDNYHTGIVGSQHVWGRTRNGQQLVPIVAALFSDERPSKDRVVEHWLYERLDFDRRQSLIDTSEIEAEVNALWEHPNSFTADEVAEVLGNAREMVESGIARSCEFLGFEPYYREWVRRTVLLLFRGENKVMDGPFGQPAFDKVALRFPYPLDMSSDDFRQAAVRMVPGSMMRTLTHADINTILMTFAYLNSGFSLGVGSMADVGFRGGSAGRLGHYSHGSGGAGIGGVLEPENARPTLVGDYSFIGANAEVAEGFVMEPFSVLAACKAALAGIKIYDATQNLWLPNGVLPAGAVAVGGSAPLSNKYPGHGKNGVPSIDCLVIVTYRNFDTHANVALNDALR